MTASVHRRLSALEPWMADRKQPKSSSRGVDVASVHLVPLLLVFLLDFETPSGALPTQMGPRILETQYGRLRGVLVPSPDPRLSPVEAYLGLQYASLLGGQLRFMPPTGPMEKWDGIRVAVKHRPVCPQRLPDLRELERTEPAAEVERWKNLLPFLENQQEDCLSLNVYVPCAGKSVKKVKSGGLMGKWIRQRQHLQSPKSL